MQGAHLEDLEVAIALPFGNGALLFVPFGALRLHQIAVNMLAERLLHELGLGEELDRLA